MITLSALLAVLSPAVTGRDSFPLSTYPMYAHHRGETAIFRTAEGLDESGELHRLSLRLIADSDDPLVAQGLLIDTIRRGDGAALCTEIARRVGGHEVRIVRVELVELTLRLDSGEELRRRVHDRCVVG